MSSKAPRPEPANAGRELSEFLLELSIALNRHAVYPDSHPSLAGAAAGVVARLDVLLRDRANVSVGVARHQLIIEGIATDESHPVLRSVAERLHRQQIGALMLSQGIDAEELRSVLRALTVEAEKLDRPLGAGDPEQLRRWKHARLYALAYGDLELIEAGEGGEGEVTEHNASSELWMGLARAAMASDDAKPDGAPASDAESVAKAINEHPAAPAYDQVIVGYLLQLATQLRESGGETTQTVRRRLSALISRLDPATLQRLVDMGGDFAQRKKFLLDSADALTTDSVLDVLKAAAKSSDQTISNSMLRMLTKMSANAVSAPRGGGADEAMRDQVKELIDGWSLTDPNPDAYTRALESMSRATGGGSDREGAESQHPLEPMRMVRMVLEVDAAGVPFWRAVHAVLAEGRLDELLDVLEASPAESRTAAAVWEKLQTADTIRQLLTTDPVDFVTLDRVLSRLPVETVTSLLLDRISESSSRATRMGVFQRIISQGSAVVPRVTERLVDERWYVLRNMLALLGEIGTCPPEVNAMQYARHERATVRREALYLATLSGKDRERAISVAFGDADERTVRVGIRAAQSGLPPASVPLVLRCLNEPTFSSELRVQVIRLVRDVKTAAVMDALMSLVSAGRTITGKTKLSPKSPEMFAALSALAHGWSGNARVAPLIDRARDSDDAEMRRAAGSPR